jgi:hypothetical protein
VSEQVVVDPSLDAFAQMLETIRHQHQWAVADGRSLRADRDYLRGVVEALLAVIGKTAGADEVARWRRIARLPEVAP